MTLNAGARPGKQTDTADQRCEIQRTRMRGRIMLPYGWSADVRPLHTPPERARTSRRRVAARPGAVNGNGGVGAQRSGRRQTPAGGSTRCTRGSSPLERAHGIMPAPPRGQREVGRKESAGKQTRTAQYEEALCPEVSEAVRRAGRRGGKRAKREREKGEERTREPNRTERQATGYEQWLLQGRTTRGQGTEGGQSPRAGQMTA